MDSPPLAQPVRVAVQESIRDNFVLIYGVA